MVFLKGSNRLKNIENRFSSHIEDLLYQMHLIEDMKHRDIGTMIDIPRVTVTKWFHRLRIPTQSCRRFTDKNLTSWLYKTGRLKKKSRYEGPDRRIQRTKGGLNVGFFKTWSAEMAYTLGYFCADGCMYKNSGGSKYISFSSTDKEILEKVKRMLNSKHKLGLRKRYNKNWKNLFSLQIGSKEMYKDLIRMGFMSNKEFRLKLPNVPKKYIRHFVRGYFDGDGCISYGYYKRKNRNKKIFSLMVRFASGSKDFLKNLSRRISLAIDLKEGYLSKNGKSFHLIYSKKESIRLFLYMYSNISEGQYLERKYNKFQKAIKCGAVA